MMNANNSLTRKAKEVQPAHFNQMIRKVFPYRFLPVYVALLTLVAMLVIGQFRYSGRTSFLSMKLFSNLLQDNAYILVMAVGMTFVILTGGIDLSVGAVVALVGLTIATLLPLGLPVWLVLLIGLLVGVACGGLIGIMVDKFNIQAFIASLAVMFLARGLCNVISVKNLSIKSEQFVALSDIAIKFGHGKTSWKITLPIIVAVIIFVVGFYLLHYTRFGRTVYGIGYDYYGNSTTLMGLRTNATRMGVYLISGFCSGIAGILFAMYTKSAHNLYGVGMELDVIAPVAIGGTILTGGFGYVLGSGIGVMAYGLLQTVISREGLNSWWAKVLIGSFLLIFILVQKGITAKKGTSTLKKEEEQPIETGKVS